MTALSNTWNSWISFMQDHPILAPAIVAIILLATIADLIKNGYLAGQPPKPQRKEDENWYTENPHRY